MQRVKELVTILFDDTDRRIVYFATIQEDSSEESSQTKLQEPSQTRRRQQTRTLKPDEL
jgi:hypothetical protein